MNVIAQIFRYVAILFNYKHIHSHNLWCVPR